MNDRKLIGLKSPRLPCLSINQSINHLFVHKKQHKMTMYNWRTGHARLGIRALEAAPKLHNYNSTRNKNSDTQKYTYIMHI